MKPIDTKNDRVVTRCTLAEMIENEVLDSGIGKGNTTDGFTLGKRGEVKVLYVGSNT